jgi:hypothetical protein
MCGWHWSRKGSKEGELMLIVVVVREI